MQKLQEAIKNASQNKLFDFFKGVDFYSREKVEKWQPKAKTLWEEGSTRILDYGGKGTKILFISPLINRASILDLSDGRSLMEFLKSAGYNPLLVDWGAPGVAEKGFSSDDYVQRLKRFISDSSDLVIGGYCMGGLLAMKLALEVKPKALVLLATPWDFHAADVNRVEVPVAMMERFIDSFEFIPPEFIQSLFVNADLWRVYDKYSSIANMPTQRKAALMEIEHWVNDGVAMTVPMAKECIVDWTIKNTPGKGRWLDAKQINVPVFLGCPTKDKIVPIGCSIPLVGLLDDVQLQKFDCGHVGMLTKKLCFEPVAKWLKRVL